MKASELIEKLIKQIEVHGDLEVSVVFDAGGGAASVNSVGYDVDYNVIDIIGD